MLNKIQYKITGTELRMKEDNRPDHTYVILTLRPLHNNEEIMREIEVDLDLAHLREITSNQEAGKIIDHLMTMSNSYYDNWDRISRQMFGMIHKELYHRVVSLSFDGG